MKKKQLVKARLVHVSASRCVVFWLAKTRHAHNSLILRTHLALQKAAQEEKLPKYGVMACYLFLIGSHALYFS